MIEIDIEAVAGVEPHKEVPVAKLHEEADLVKAQNTVQDRGRKSGRSSPPERRSPRRRSPPERKRRSPPERINSPPKRSRSRRHSRSSSPKRSSPRRHSRRSRSRRSRSLSRSDGIIYLLIKILLITLLINFYNRNKINSNNVELSDRRSP